MMEPPPNLQTGLSFLDWENANSRHGCVRLKMESDMVRPEENLVDRIITL